MAVHTEGAFEQHIADYLVEHGGYVLRLDADYDRKRAILPADVLAYIESTQKPAWDKLKDIHKDKLAEVFLAELCKVMDRDGSLSVLRKGVKFYGKTILLARFAPSHGLNPQVQAEYDANRLAVVRQVHYDLNNENSIDLVLFCNGIPILTAELKNQMTGQRACEHAVNQYKFDRDAKAPLLRFKQRALAHFAIDPDEAWMTTKLQGAATTFLPFNKGNGTAAGNPPVEGKHRTHYVWEQVWQRDSMLDIIAGFLHLEVKEKDDKKTGKKVRTETMVFPRFHQFDAVHRLIDAARTNGSGKNYLVQHSAGSGKSNTIAWVAHRLASLHGADDKKVYDSVIVITDRRVLDKQLRDTIYQFEHKQGVVEKIDKNSEQLAHALSSGTPIIITTLHKFGFVQDKIGKLPQRKYAIIVDEAHSSQSGEMAVNLKEVLADPTLADTVKPDNDDLSTPDQLAMRAALVRGPQANMSFFAFTATPKFKTLEVFGHHGPDGLPAPFHLYSMRQAIEEHFILDVLRGYTTYKRYFKLVKAVSEDPELDKNKAAKALARFVSLHPTVISQKTEIIIEHFRACVMKEIGGQAKAMVVTGSRLAAVKYKQSFDKYLAEKGYADVTCLVAFSGEVADDVTAGVKYTEVEMNHGIKELELPDVFGGDGYNVLVVAEKFQTGFDQPLLSAMYVDKRLAGIQAVQTLSRLNRTCPGKDKTFVLDFVNEADEIEKAFQQFYEQAVTDQAVDPQRMYDLESQLDAAGVYLSAEVDKFAKVFFQPKNAQAPLANAQLNAAVDPAVDRFKALEPEAQEAFRGTLIAFKSLYGFVAQIVPFQDAGLEKLYAYGRMLLRKLPRPPDGGPLDLDDDVALYSLALKKTADADIPLKPGEVQPLTGPTATGTGTAKSDKEKLSNIIEQINLRFATDFDAQDLVDGVTEQLVADKAVQQAAAVNDKANFTIEFSRKLDDALVERHGKHAEFIERVFGDDALGKMFRALMLETVYGRLKAKPTELEVHSHMAARDPEPRVRKTTGVCGGAARIRDTRIPVWTLVQYRRLGLDDAGIMQAFPQMDEEDLAAAWAYAQAHVVEIDQDIADNAEITA